MKKTLTLALLTAFFFSCVSAPSDPEFSLSIEFDEEESSDDSNGEGISITVLDNYVDYSWGYWGYHPNDDYVTSKKKKKNLSDEELLELKAFIEELALWDEVYEDKASNLLGDSLYVELSLSDEERSVYSEVSGMSWALDTREGNIENLEFVDEVQDLVNFIEDQIDV